MTQNHFDGIPRPSWASPTQFPYHIWSDVQYEAKHLGFTLQKFVDDSVSYPDSEDWDRFVVRKGDLFKEFRRPVQGERPRGCGFEDAIVWMRGQQ